MYDNSAVVGLQWGDEGKGKIVDLIADDYYAIARFNGGANAGHTVIANGSKYVFHLLPSAALKNKKLFISQGVALDPILLDEEMRLSSAKDVSVDPRCSVVTPLDKEMDREIESMRGEKRIGTTGRGIGPCYAERALRVLPRATDVASDEFDFNSLMKFYERFLARVDVKEMNEWLKRAGGVLKPLLKDVPSEIRMINEEGKRVLFEGSQGALLDIIYGTYPHVTSSSTLATSIPYYCGIGLKDLTGIIGVMKCYTTRVGGGFFPTEIKGELCKKLREEGREYGSTTGRARRIGWLDFVALMYAIKLNNVDEVALTKVDVLAKLDEFNICEAYSVNGEETTDFLRATAGNEEVKPVYSRGWKIGEINSKLSGDAMKFVEHLEDELRVKVRIVSYGEERDKVIFLE